MSRIKRGTIKNKKRKNVLTQAKGYRFGRSTKLREAKQALQKAKTHAFTHRKHNKRNFRRLWTIKLNAALRPLGLSYSKFIDAIHKKDIALDRKVLSQMAEHEPKSFERLVEQIK